MRNKTKISLIFLIFILSAAAGAGEYRFTYKSGDVAKMGGVITSGDNSSFAISYGAAAEIRCGSNSNLVPGKISKTAESFFTLETGSCFVRLIDDGSGASINLVTPFAVLKSNKGAFYAGCPEKSVSVYGGSAGVEFGKRLLKLTAGKTFQDGKVTEVKNDVNEWKNWNFSRDKTDIFIKLKAGDGREEKTGKYLADAIAKSYYAGNIAFVNGVEPQSVFALVTITAKDGTLKAAGIVSSELTGTSGIIDVRKKSDKEADPLESSVFMPFIYEVSESILLGIEQVEANALKNGRKVIIEAEGLSDTGCAMVEKLVSKMPGFVSVKQEKHHNIKAVFEIMLYGTGYDIYDAINTACKKSNINIWKYSKNIVKLRAVKVER